MPRWLVFSLLLTLLVIPSSAGAQGEPKLESINIELRSEYDQPSMFVIYGFKVSEETRLPAEVTLRFPDESNLFAIGVKHGDTWHNKDYTISAEQGGWQTIKITAETYEPHRFEYYQPLTFAGDKRQFKLQWYGDYSVDEFTVKLLIPADSRDLVTSHALDEIATADDRLLTTGTVTKRNLKMMNSFQFALEYNRTSMIPVQQGQATSPVVPVAPVDENTSGRFSITNLPWIIGGFGVALIGIALFSYWRSTQSGESQPLIRRPRKPREAELGQAYCHECGTRALARDRFCRTCGSRIKME